MILRIFWATGKNLTSLTVHGLVSLVILVNNGFSQCMKAPHSLTFLIFLIPALLLWHLCWSLVLLQKSALHAARRNHLSQYRQTHQTAETVSTTCSSLPFLFLEIENSRKISYSINLVLFNALQRTGHFIRTAYMELFLLKLPTVLS